jgi:pimeloyl-ACP methyl ester carboxylesterase
MALDVVRLLDHLKIEKAHLIGYSMGGFVANKARELHPERFHSMILGGSGWYRRGDPAIAELTAREIAEGLERTGDFRFMLRAFEANRNPPVSDEEIEARNRRMMEGSDPSALAAVLRGWEGFAVSEENLGSNSVPSIAIVGSNDPIKPKTDRLAEVMRRLEVSVIEGADHGALADPRFTEEVIRFLNQQGARGSGAL